MKLTGGKQGKVVVERSEDQSVLLVMFPDGSVTPARTRREAYMGASPWFRAHLTADIGIGEIEWRDGLGAWEPMLRRSEAG